MGNGAKKSYPQSLEMWIFFRNFRVRRAGYAFLQLVSEKNKFGYVRNFSYICIFKQAIYL